MQDGTEMAANRRLEDTETHKSSVQGVGLGRGGREAGVQTCLWNSRKEQTDGQLEGFWCYERKFNVPTVTKRCTG